MADAKRALDGVRHEKLKDIGGGLFATQNVPLGKTAGGIYIPLLVDANGNLLTQLSGSLVVLGTQIGTDQAVAFANSAAENTQVNVDFVKPATVRNRYKLAIYNPSTVTDLTVKIMSAALTFGGATQYNLIDTITIPKSQALTGTTVSSYAKFIEGLFVGVDVRLVISNNTVLGGADGFTGYVRLREV